MSNRTLGQIVDELEATLTLADGDFPVGVVITLKVMQADGLIRLSHTTSKGISWIEAIGMLHTAEYIELNSLNDGRVDE